MKRGGGEGGQLLCDDTQREIQENFNAFFLISREGRECKEHECWVCVECEYEYSLRCTNQLTALIDNWKQTNCKLPHVCITPSQSSYRKTCANNCQYFVLVIKSATKWRKEKEEKLKLYNLFVVWSYAITKGATNNEGVDSFITQGYLIIYQLL